MEDHHVDRKRVEVRQRMKLSFTNSSFGLILSLVNVHLLKAPKGALKRLDGLRSRLSAPVALSSAGARKSARRPLGLAKPEGFGKCSNQLQNKTSLDSQGK